MGKKKIMDIVLMILTSDEKSRDSDRYLYKEVLKQTNPSILSMSVEQFLSMKSGFPKFETVGRARRHFQSELPNTLGSSKSVKESREYEELEYREAFANGRRVDQFTS